MWSPELTLREAVAARRDAAHKPLFQRIADALIDEIRRGRLRPGQRLPGSRTLAGGLEVNRNTVTAALDELEAQGWVVREAARGTFVAEDLPRALEGGAPSAAEGEVSPRAGFDLPPPFAAASGSSRVRRPGEPAEGAAERRGAAAERKYAFSLIGGLPDPRLIPTTLLARAYRRALCGVGGAELLGYGYGRADDRLLDALGAMLSAARGVVADRSSLVVTRGSQQALYLLGRCLLGEAARGTTRNRGSNAGCDGAVVAVEQLGYPPAWQALALAGAELAPLPVDAYGLDVGALAELCRRRRVRAAYVTPHHQYPTTATLQAARRLELLELARRHRFAIIEDDYDHEFHFSGRPVLPLASADRHGVVVYVGTLSKIFAPGVRVGYVVAPPELCARLRRLRLFVDRQGDRAVERAIAELFEDGEIQRHARRVRRIYAARRACLDAALRRELGHVLRYELPRGGMALWAEAPGVDVERWAARAAERGVYFAPASEFDFNGRTLAALRLGYAAHDEGEIEQAVGRLAAALPVKG